MQTMADALEPGITTAELDAIGRKVLEDNGAQSAPEFCYKFPGATCISVNEEVAHGIPGPRIIKAGDLVNIDVSAVKNGFSVTRVRPSPCRLSKGHRAAVPRWQTRHVDGIAASENRPALRRYRQCHRRLCQKNRYTLITNLASHGIGRSLHEEPKELATWPDKDERRIMQEGMVFTVEPFLSTGAYWAEDGDDDPWTLYSDPSAPTVQYEHTVVATKNGPLVLTLVE